MVYSGRNRRSSEVSWVSNAERIADHSSLLADIEGSQAVNECEAWYILSLVWFNALKEFIQTNFENESMHPGKIMQEDIIHPKADGFKGGLVPLKQGLSEGNDYIIIPKVCWDKIKLWYGLNSIHHEILRFSLFVNEAQAIPTIETHPLQFSVYLYGVSDPDKGKNFLVSRITTFENFDKMLVMCFFDINGKDHRLWRKPKEQPMELLEFKPTVRFGAVDFGSEEIIIIETCSAYKNWPLDNAQTRQKLFKNSNHVAEAAISRNESENSHRYSLRRHAVNGTPSPEKPFSNSQGNYEGPKNPGHVGLANLGNTCYLNSTLQCLAHLPDVRDYFLSKLHMRELNKTNPLGHNGTIATSFGDLIRHLWSDEHSYTPRYFKVAISRAYSQFYGFQQQDSQEFMTYLMDGLHEDLNRIIEKPYVEYGDADGRSDEELAEESWVNFRRRNQSVIVDLFFGMIKSTVTCPDCEKVSVTFDPINQVSCPLPSPKDRSLMFWFFGAFNKKALKMVANLDEDGTVGDLFAWISEEIGANSKMLVLAEVINQKVHAVFTSSQPLSELHDKDPTRHFVYEIHSDCFGEKASNPEDCVENKNLCVLYIRNKSNPKSLCQPIIMHIPDPVLPSDLYRLVEKHMYRAISIVNLSNEDMQLVKSKGIDLDSATTPGSPSHLEAAKLVFDLQYKTHTPVMEIHQVNAMGHENIRTIPNPRYPKTVEERERTIRLNYPTDHVRNRLKPIFLSISVEDNFIEDWWNTQEADEYANHQSNKKSKKYTVTLRDCIRVFLQPERLSEREMWYCACCKEHKRAKKKLDFWSLPNYLIIHLKRFNYNRFWRDKLTTPVVAPDELDMSPFVVNTRHSKPMIYDFCGVSCHSGSLTSGHYWANCKDRDNTWWNFNDSSSQQTSAAQACGGEKGDSSNYILFYKLRGFKYDLYNLSVPNPLHASGETEKINNDTEAMEVDENVYTGNNKDLGDNMSDDEMMGSGIYKTAISDLHYNMALNDQYEMLKLYGYMKDKDANPNEGVEASMRRVTRSLARSTGSSGNIAIDEIEAVMEED